MRLVPCDLHGIYPFRAQALRWGGDGEAVQPACPACTLPQAQVDDSPGKNAKALDCVFFNRPFQAENESPYLHHNEHFFAACPQNANQYFGVDLGNVHKPKPFVLRLADRELDLLLCQDPDKL